MEAIQTALNSLTPAVLFVVLFLGVSIAFFVYYWFAITPRKGTLEWIAMSEAQPRRLTFTLKRHPMERLDILPLLLITVLYACTAFFRLVSL